MRIKLLLIGALAFCWGAFSTPASAQTISCASQDNGRQYCGADTRGGVTLIRQNSNSPCIENQTWGYDGRGIWVDRGCRAEFQVGNFYPGGPGGPGSRGDTISCESTNNRINYCRIDNVNSNVEVIQQLSQSPCIRGSTWGNDGQGIWVDRGCRATFRVSAYGYNGPGWWNSGPGRPPTNQPRNARAFLEKRTTRRTTFAWSEAPASPSFRTDSTIRSAPCGSMEAPPSLPLATETSAVCPSYSGAASWTFATCGFGAPTIKLGTTGSARSV
jgi:hypothetical protein